MSAFSGKTVLVTGVSGDMGRKVVEKLASSNLLVVGLDKKPFEVDPSFEKSVLFFECDISNKESIDKVIKEVFSKVERIDYLVNVAGILNFEPLLDTTWEDISHVFSINLFGAFHITKLIANSMIKNGFGSIVNISSNAAKVPRVNMAAYCSSKSALSMLTKCFALELSKHGIRCNAISPGSTRTDMQTAMWADEKGEQKTIEGNLSTFKTGIPLAKIAEPKEIASLVSFLLSDEASHITMQDIVIDGGAILGV